MVSLFRLSLDIVCDHYSSIRHDLDVISASTLCDIFYTMTKRRGNELQIVKTELSHLPTFVKLLRTSQKRHELNWIFQVINNQDLSNMQLSYNPQCEISPTKSLLGAQLEMSYSKECAGQISTNRVVLFKNGMLLGEFLYNAGWFYESALVLRQCLFICLSEKGIESFKNGLRCLERLLLTQTQYNMIKETQKTFKTACAIIDELEATGTELNLAKMYSAFANYHFNENRYTEALKWSVEALKKLDTMLDTKIDVVVDVLRQSAKCCAFRREFAKAELLITKAVYLARDFYGPKSVKYADALFDYGYFLINSDSVRRAVSVYIEVLEIRKEAFGIYNLMTAIAFEELAYALYVQEYSTGNFASARKYSDQALSLMTVLLDKDHLQLASAKRVNALILEEIAIESAGTPLEQQLLKEAESLHLYCLDLTTNVFGDMNVQTAKHYGNLGRLYQTMKKFQDAELMHLKAISIKERLLGKLDYEVALSVGHLASLYNYDMHQYDKAEQLHLRSIEIGRKLFGDSYSGLEYDYRGLLQVYNMDGNLTKLAEYTRILNQWRVLQDLKSTDSHEQPIRNTKYSQPVSKVIRDFFDMEWCRNESSSPS